MDNIQAKKITQLDPIGSIGISNLTFVGDPLTGVLYQGTYNQLKTLFSSYFPDKTTVDSLKISKLYTPDGSEVTAYTDASKNLFLAGGLNLPYASFDIDNAAPAYAEGLLFYNKDKHALSTYLDALDVELNLGFETLIRVYNNTGSTILNGKVVAPLATTIPPGETIGLPTIQLANARDKHKCRLVAMATMDIPNNSVGYVTKFGSVSGVDTSSFNQNALLYLSDTTPGGITDQRPTDGGYPVIMGAVAEVGVSGKVIIDIQVGDNTVEVNDTNGFPPDQRTNTLMTVNNGLLQCTIAASSYPYHYYVLGEKYEQEDPQTVTFTDIEGQKWVYFDETGIQFIHNPSPAQIIDIILKYAFACEFWWNATDKRVELDIMDERHGISMNPQTHLYLHRTRGAQFISGFGLGDILTEQLGNLPTHAQLSVSTGEYVDEDISHILSSPLAVNSVIPTVYLSGTSANLRSVINTISGQNYPVLSNGSSRVYYNQLNGSDWQLTEVPNNGYCLYHIFGINGQATRIVSIMGQSSYSSITAARNAASNEVATIKVGLPLAEIIPIGTLLVQSRNSTVTANTLSASRSGAVVTVISTNHGLVTGATINVTATFGSQTTGNKIITFVDENTFTFTGVNAGTNSGTLSYTVDAFTNGVFARFRTIGGANYIDWRTTELAQGVTPSSHANLTNVLQAGLGVLDGHISDQAQSIYGTKTFENNVVFKGNITQTQPGTIEFVNELQVADAIIYTRQGAVTGLGVNEYTGIQARLYDGTNDGQLVFDKDGVARVGDVGSTQAISTRQDAPTNLAISYWNDTAKRFDTNSLLTINANGQLVSTVLTATGSPFTVLSTTKVTNLNADSVDGIGISAATAGYLPVVSGANYTDSVLNQSGSNIQQVATNGSYIFSDGGAGTHNIRGIGAGGVIQFKYDVGSTDRYVRLGMQDNSLVFTPVLNIHNNLNVGIGFTTGPSEKVHIQGNARVDGIATHPILRLNRINSTFASPTAIVNGNTISQINFGGQYDTTVGNITAGAIIRATASGNWSSTSAMPTKLEFLTSPASGANQVVLTLNSDKSAEFTSDLSIVGDIKPSANIRQQGTPTLFVIDPYQQILFGYGTNNANFRVAVMKGDNTNTFAHELWGNQTNYIDRLGKKTRFGGTVGADEMIDVTGNVKAVTFISTQATGTAPFSVQSITKVANLNADLLDDRTLNNTGGTGDTYIPYVASGEFRVQSSGDNVQLIAFNTVSTGESSITLGAGTSASNQFSIKTYGGSHPSNPSQVKITSSNPVYCNTSISVGNNSATASAENVGSIRYRETATHSYVDICTRISSSPANYEWTNVITKVFS